MNSQHTLLVSATPSHTIKNITGGWIPLITYGGVAVAVILAIAFLNKIQFDYLIKLVKALKNKQP